MGPYSLTTWCTWLQKPSGPGCHSPCQGPPWSCQFPQRLTSAPQRRIYTLGEGASIAYWMHVPLTAASSQQNRPRWMPLPDGVKSTLEADKGWAPDHRMEFTGWNLAPRSMAPYLRLALTPLISFLPAPSCHRQSLTNDGKTIILLKNVSNIQKSWKSTINTYLLSTRIQQLLIICHNLSPIYNIKQCDNILIYLNIIYIAFAKPFW